jgi:type I restriction enzyme M protein
MASRWKNITATASKISAGNRVRKRLLHDCAQGVKANVLFFDRKPASETPWTRTLWIYDLRTNQHFEIVEDLQAALDQFAQIAADLAATESEAERN